MTMNRIHIGMGITGGYKLFDFSQFEGCGTDGLCALMQIDAAKRLSLGMFDDFNIFQLFFRCDA